MRGQPLGLQFQVNAYATGDQLWPQVAADELGNLVVVWQSSGSAGGDTSDTSIQARRFRPDSTPLDEVEFQVNQYTNGYQRAPDVAVDAFGGFRVVWESEGSFGSDDQEESIQARHFSADGTPQDPLEIQLNVYESGAQRIPSIASAGEVFVVTWMSSGSFGNDDWSYSIQGRRFALNGGALDPIEFQVNAYTPYDQVYPEVAGLPTGGFVVVWESDVTTGNDTHIGVQGRRFGPGGGPLDPVEFQVNTYTTNGQFVPVVAADPEGHFVVAWTSVWSSGTDQDGSIQARRYRADGAPLEVEEFQLNTFTTENQGGPSLARAIDGDFVATWASYRSSGPDQDGSVQARRFGRPTIQVTSTSGGTGGPGCTLKDAMLAANIGAEVGECTAGNEGAVIALPAASTIAFSEIDNGANALPVVERPITIRGSGASIDRDPGLACPVGPAFRLFEVTDGGMLTLEDVVISNGCLLNEPGGAILVNRGTLVLREASIEGNESGSGGGGVAVAGGNFLAIDSSIRGNLAAGSGGGIAAFDNAGWLAMSGSTVSENSAWMGGGLALDSGSTLVIRNSTFSDNSAQASGGGIELGDSMAHAVLEFASVAGNAAPDGAGLRAGEGLITFHGSLIGDNLTGSDCATAGGSWEASGANLDTDGTCASLAGGNVTTVASLGLSSLEDHGGPTPTRIPVYGSPALDAAPACATRSGALLAIDQRGYLRPTDDDGDGDPECDLGAVERGPLFIDGFELGGSQNWSLTVG